ncbi:MAG: hypothetical protein BWY94_02468 [Actinobacteria bacterium ADurb.BinA094]|nr:MAG: hypothetical protein BWY94_02468 [Actinobacteria bacterium ADurb.BinA094]
MPRLYPWSSNRGGWSRAAATYCCRETPGRVSATIAAVCCRVDPSGTDTLTVGGLAPRRSPATRESYGSLTRSVYVPGMKRVA